MGRFKVRKLNLLLICVDIFIFFPPDWQNGLWDQC